MGVLDQAWYGIKYDLILLVRDDISYIDIFAQVCWTYVHPKRWKVEQTLGRWWAYFGPPDGLQNPSGGSVGAPNFAGQGEKSDINFFEFAMLNGRILKKWDLKPLNGSYMILRRFWDWTWKLQFSYVFIPFEYQKQPISCGIRSWGHRMCSARCQRSDRSPAVSEMGTDTFLIGKASGGFLEGTPMNEIVFNRQSYLKWGFP